LVAAKEGFLPPYSVRVSERAQNARLVMTAERGLEIVVPRRFDRRRIPELLLAKQEWIARASRRMEATRHELAANPPRLPAVVVLPFTGEERRVEYRPPSLGAWGTVATGTSLVSKGASAREHRDGRLVVTGVADDVAACQKALRLWLRRKARTVLVSRLEELSREHGLRYQRVTIRQQRSRWGSCSQRGSISLNASLLFLPPALVDYVLLHELCHTVELNHSARFWTLLGYHDPACKAHRRALRRIRASLPAWVDHDLGEPAL
jgi:predicted metal-dependent hydrolase